MLAVLAPGQGAQAPGQLLPWLDVAGARADLREWSDAAGVDLLALGTTADADALRDTAAAQPLLVATSLLSARTLETAPDVVAGHSVGEWAAAALSGAVDERDAVALAVERGRAMAAACAATPTGMSAVLGGERAVVRQRLDELGLTAANDNGPSQLVAAGDLDALQVLADDPPPRTRVRPLAVAGAFHTSAMGPAVPALERAAAACAWRSPQTLLLSDLDGAEVTDGGELRRRLVEQVVLPVRFDLVMQRLQALGVTRVVELAPAGTLRAIVRRALPDVEAVAIDAPQPVAVA